ncbi:MAG: RHS repeat-associated core domain-containing protein [Bacteroidota bacterium]
MGCLKLDILKQKTTTLKLAYRAEVLTKNENGSYYPFGLKHKHASQTFTELSTATNSRYGYNNKELVSEMGLDWMPYGKRMFDPATCRFISVDPIADQFAWVSPYNYAENEPIANIDLHGLQASSMRNGYAHQEVKRRVENMGKQVQQNVRSFGRSVKKAVNNLVNQFTVDSDDGTYTTPGGMVNTMEGGKGEENHRAENPEGGTEVDEIVAIGTSSAPSNKAGFLKKGKDSGSNCLELISNLSETVDKTSTAGNKIVTIGENVQKLSNSQTPEELESQNLGDTLLHEVFEDGSPIPRLKQ